MIWVDQPNYEWTWRFALFPRRWDSRRDQYDVRVEKWIWLQWYQTRLVPTKSRDEYMVNGVEGFVEYDTCGGW